MEKEFIEKLAYILMVMQGCALDHDPLFVLTLIVEHFSDDELDQICELAEAYREKMNEEVKE